MAGVLSGSFSKAFDSNAKHSIGIKWSATQNATKLTSTVTVTVFYTVASGWSINKGTTTSAISLTINGTKYTGSGTIGNLNGGSKDLWSKTVTLNHNSSTGELDLSLSASVAVNATLSGTYYGTESTGSKTYEVQTIEVAPTVKTVTLTNKGFRWMTFSFTASSTITKIEYRYKKTTDSTWGRWKTVTYSSGVTSGSTNITGLDTGTSYDAQMKLYNSAGKYYTSSTKTASTYPAPTASELSDLELNNVATTFPFKITNTGNDGYLKAYISVKYGDSESDVNDSVLSVSLGAFTNGNTYTWSLSQANVNTIANLLTTQNGKIRIRIESFGDSSYGDKIEDAYSEWVNLTLNKTTYAPIFSGSLSITRDATATNIFGSSKSNYIIQNQTNMSYSFTAATGQQSATIKSYKIECYDKTNSTLLESKTITAVSGVYGTINFVGSILFRVTATDSRGLTATLDSGEFVSVKYTVPTLSVDVKRDSDDTTNAKITFYGSFSSLEGSNSITIFNYQFKEITADNPSGGEYGTSHNITSTNYTITQSEVDNSIKQIATNSSGIVSSGYSAGSNYVFRFTLKDKITTIAVETNLTEGIPLLRILENGQCSVNGLPDLDLDDQNYKFFVHGNSYTYGSCKTDSGFFESSLEELKTGISKFREDAFEIIENSDIYKYHLKSALSNGDLKERIGFVIGEGYNLDDIILSHSKKEIDIYSSIGVLWKGEQQLIDEIGKLQEEICKLKEEIEILKSRS